MNFLTTLEYYTTRKFKILYVIILAMITKEISFVFNEEFIIGSASITLMLVLYFKLKDMIIMEITSRNFTIVQQIQETLEMNNLVTEMSLDLISEMQDYSKDLENVEVVVTDSLTFLNNFRDLAIYNKIVKYFENQQEALAKLNAKNFLNLLLKFKKLELRLRLVSVGNIA